MLQPSVTVVAMVADSAPYPWLITNCWSVSNGEATRDHVLLKDTLSHPLLPPPPPLCSLFFSHLFILFLSPQGGSLSWTGHSRYYNVQTVLIRKSS